MVGLAASSSTAWYFVGDKHVMKLVWEMVRVWWLGFVTARGVLGEGLR